MNLLIVYAHPNHQSLNYSILSKTLEGLGENTKQYKTQVLDLYAEDFDPILVFNDTLKRRDLKDDPTLTTHREQLMWADKIVFIYPIWWGRPPAMLLGYFDRILAKGFAYKYHDGKVIPEGMLKNKSVTCISTMGGPTFYPKLLLNNAHKILMRKAVLNFVGIKKVKFFEFGFMETKKGKQEKALTKIQNYFQTL